MIAGPSRKCNNLAELSNDEGSDEEEADSTTYEEMWRLGSVA